MITNFYFPVEVEIFTHDLVTNKLIPSIGWEGWRESLLEDIRSAVNDWCDDMSYYIDDEPFEDKVKSIFYDLVLVGKDTNLFYGKVSIEHLAEFTRNEIDAIKEWIEGQNSDGCGEGLACQQYMSHDLTFKINFWNSHESSSYKIYSENEWEDILVSVQV